MNPRPKTSPDRPARPLSSRPWPPPRSCAMSSVPIQTPTTRATRERPPRRRETRSNPSPRARHLKVLSNSMTTTTTPMTTRTTRDALNRRLYTSNSRRTRARTRERRKKRHRLRNYPTFSASTRARSTRRRSKKKRSPSSMRTVSNACTRGMKTSFDGGSIRGAENRNRTRDL